MKYIEGEHFDDIDYSINPFPKGEYENCYFKNCIFNDTDLSECRFSDCSFELCNLSNAKLSKVQFKKIHFKNCRMLGLFFTELDPFLLSIICEDCDLSYSSFYELKLQGTKFESCILEEVDFVSADLSKAIITNCKLTGAQFENTNLEKSDFRGSTNYSISPELNKIKGAHFSQNGLIGLLDKFQIKIEMSQ